MAKTDISVTLQEGRLTGDIVLTIRKTHIMLAQDGEVMLLTNSAARKLYEALDAMVNRYGHTKCDGGACGEPCSKCGADYGGRCSGTGDGSQCHDGVRECECGKINAVNSEL